MTQKNNTTKATIFEQVKEGKLSIEDAIKLLDHLPDDFESVEPEVNESIDEDILDDEASFDEESSDKSEETSSKGFFGKKKADKKRKMLRVIVDGDDGTKVKVNVPVSLMKVALKFGKEFDFKDNPLKDANIDLDEILQAVDQDLEGEIVTVESSDKNSVKIYVD